MGGSNHGTTLAIEKIIALMDCNNFYVSCERLFKPALEKKAIVILSHDNGCIIARSNKVKQLKIKIGTPFFEVKTKLAKIDTIAITANMQLYRTISARVMQSLKLLTKKHTIYSIDEAFFEIDDNEELYQKCYTIAKTIEQWTGIPVSIGASYSKTLAKLACKQAKKIHKPVIATSLSEINQMLETTAVADIWGIGQKTSRKLEKINIKTAKELITLDPTYAKKHLGIEILKTMYELQGIDNIEIQLKPKKASISSSKILKIKNHTPETIRTEIAKHIGIICKKAFKQGTPIEKMEIKLYSNNSKLKHTIHDSPNLNAATWLILAKKFIASANQENFLCQRVKVSAIITNNQQNNLLNKTRETTKIILDIQNKFGKKSLFLATGAYTDKN